MNHQTRSPSNPVRLKVTSPRVSTRTTNALLLTVALATLASVLYLAGCFETKINARRTAQLLVAANPAARTASCRGGSHGWDYTCTIVLRSRKMIVVDVSVDAHNIKSQSAP